MGGAAVPLTLDRLRIIVGLIIVGTWLTSLIAEPFLPLLTAHREIGYLMLAFAGWLFGPRLRWSKKLPEVNGPEEP